MERVSRIPLKQRLQSAGKASSNFLAVFELFAEDYLWGLDRRTRGSYWEKVSTLLEEYGDISLTSQVMAEVLHLIMELPAEVYTELLYLMLIEPYAIPKEHIAKGENK